MANDIVKEHQVKLRNGRVDIDVIAAYSTAYICIFFYYDLNSDENNTTSASYKLRGDQHITYIHIVHPLEPYNNHDNDNGNIVHHAKVY